MAPSAIRDRSWGKQYIPSLLLLLLLRPQGTTNAEEQLLGAGTLGSISGVY